MEKFKSSTVAEMGDRLDKIDMGRKLGVTPPFWEGVGSWIPTQNNVVWAEAHLRTKWHLDASSRLATIEIRLAAIDIKT